MDKILEELYKKLNKCECPSLIVRNCLPEGISSCSKEICYHFEKCKKLNDVIKNYKEYLELADEE